VERSRSWAFRAGVFAVLVALASCSGSVTGPSAPAPNTADMANPPEVDSANGTLNVTLTAAINPATGAPGLEYNGAFFPPTLRVNPGDTLNITYVNSLPPSSTIPYNETNLHFHGLSTSPNPPADDAIDMLAMPGQTLHYSVPIPSTQPPGAYWYHAHPHGESDWQMDNGMSGALIVNGTASFVSQTAGLPERIIVLRNVLAQPVFADLQDGEDGEMAHRNLARSDQSATPAPAVCQQPYGVPSMYTTVNGFPAGTQRIVVPPGQKQLWRVVNASSDGYFVLSIDGQQLQVVSVDGVPMTEYPGGAAQSVSQWVLAPSARVEFIVTGTSANAAFRSSCMDTGPVGDPNPPEVLAMISPTGKVATLPTVPAPSTPALGTYQETMPAPAQQRTVTFAENAAGTQFYLNGQQYSTTGSPMFTVSSGTTEEWTLINTTNEVHDFHTHQIHFIVLDVNGVPQPPFWRDTFTIPYEPLNGQPTVTHVLLDFRDPEIKGTFLFHCHIEQHADDGMMAKILVQ
jgi:suppressor of ftsI